MNDIFRTEKYNLNPHNGSGSLILTKSYLERKQTTLVRKNFLDIPIKVSNARENPVNRTINYTPEPKQFYPIIQDQDKKSWLVKDPSTITNEETFIYFK